MNISSILSTKGSDVSTVPVGTAVRDAVTLLAEKRIGAVPVIDGGGISGIVEVSSQTAAASRQLQREAESLATLAEHLRRLTDGFDLGEDGPMRPVAGRT